MFQFIKNQLFVLSLNLSSLFANIKEDINMLINSITVLFSRCIKSTNYVNLPYFQDNKTDSRTLVVNNPDQHPFMSRIITPQTIFFYTAFFLIYPIHRLNLFNSPNRYYSMKFTIKIVKNWTFNITWIQEIWEI